MGEWAGQSRAKTAKGWLAAGCWLLAAGCWLLAAGCSTCVLLMRQLYFVFPRGQSARLNPTGATGKAKGSGAKQKLTGKAKGSG